MRYVTYFTVSAPRCPFRLHPFHGRMDQRIGRLARVDRLALGRDAGEEVFAARAVRPFELFQVADMGVAVEELQPMDGKPPANPSIN